jgi:hypothetical protein
MGGCRTGNQCALQRTPKRVAGSFSAVPDSELLAIVTDCMELVSSGLAREFVMAEQAIIEEVGRLITEARMMDELGEDSRASRRLHTAAHLLDSHQLPQLSVVVAIVDSERRQSGFNQ